MYAKEDINGKVLYEKGSHAFIWLGADPNYRKGVVQTNQYLVIDNGKGYLFDPGGIHLFARVVAVASRYVALDRIEAIFYSHQDPDVSSGIALWLGVTKAKILISQLWTRFLPHFGIVDESRIKAIEAVGSTYEFGSGAKARFLPAHFLHSPGQFNFFDQASGALFTGDIGAAVFGEGEEELFASDWEKHVALMEGFHKRYMAGNAATRAWAEAARALNPTMICPQHGAIMQGDMARRFIAWMADLRCGIDMAADLYKATL
jgi:flavorubredoxin